MDASLTFGVIESVLSVGLGGLTWWLWRLEDKSGELKSKLDEHRVDLARNYHSKEELRQVINDAIFPLREDVNRLTRAVEKLSDNE